MVLSTKSSVAVERKGYSRGLILGFTMAETLLLLVFCLLLLIGASLKLENDKRKSAEISEKLATANLRIAENELIKLSEEVKVLGTNEPTRQKEWRELVLASGAIKVLEAEGFKADEAPQLAALLKKLKQENIDFRKLELIANQLADGAKYTELLAKLNDAALKPDDIEALQEDKKKLAELEKLKSKLDSVGIDATNIDGLAGKLRQLSELEAVQKDAKPHEWPPIINLSEAGGFYFQSGKAELTPEFSRKLQSDISNQIVDNLAKYDVDIIEVIGHTDEQPISRKSSNLDEAFIGVLNGKMAIGDIIPADNAGLGLARALSVVNTLKMNERLRNATILPMSAAQLILPSEELTKGQAGDVESRRRIEIRIRKRNNPLSQN